MLVLARLDVDDIPKKHRAGMHLTTNCGYLLVMGPDGRERERLIVRGNDPKRTAREQEQHFSVAAVRRAMKSGTATDGKGRSGFELLAHLLRQPDPRVRVDAAEQVMQHHGEDAAALVPVLLVNLTQTDGHPWLGSRSAHALGRLGPRSAQALPRMLALLESPETKPALARALLHVLHDIDPEGHQILATLRRNLGRDEPRVAGALESVKGLGPRAASLVPEVEKALLGGRRTYLQVNAAKALMEIGKDAAPALPSLHKLAGDAKPKVQNQWGDVSTAAAQAVKVIEAALARENR